MPLRSPLSPDTKFTLSISERDVIKTVLEFLEIRGFYITQLSLERETGVINGEFSDDLLFLRQLILDGQWDNALDFVEPLKSVKDFDFQAFRYNITKYKFFELLCVKLEPGPLHDNDFAVEELVECLKDLEHMCPNPDDYRHLCALLTLPKLSDHADFKNWNPSSARVECFHKIHQLLAHLLPPTANEKNQEAQRSSINDRLFSLLAKGRLYEGCVDYCQSQAANTRHHPHPTASHILATRTPLSSTDLSLLSWLEMVTREQFTTPFHQKHLELRVDPLTKPRLDATWTETILATPIKPRNQFPHNLVPRGAKLKFAEKMSQSMLIANHPTPTRQMSHSTAPGFCLGIADPPADAMAQSQIIDGMMEASELAKSITHDFTPIRKQLDEMTRRSTISRLPPVPELGSPVDPNPMTRSALYQKFSATKVSHAPQLLVASHQRSRQTMGGVEFVPVCRYEDSQAIRATCFHPSGRFFALGTNSKQLILAKHPDRGVRAVRDAHVLLTRSKQHRGSVYCVAFNPHGDLLASGSNDKTIRLMAFNEENCRIGAEMELNSHDGTVRDLIFIENTLNRSTILVSGGAGSCHLSVTDCNTGQQITQLKGHSAPILGLYTWSSNQQFVSCSQDKTIRFWDLRQPTPIITPTANKAPVTSVCIDPSGKLLVSGHEDASVSLFDIQGNRVLQTFRPHVDEVRSVRFSNAAYYLLTASYDKRVVITDMRGDLTSPLVYLPVAEHSDKVIQCRWHPHDFSFLSTSADRSAVLWALPRANSD